MSIQALSPMIETPEVARAAETQARPIVPVSEAAKPPGPGADGSELARALAKEIDGGRGLRANELRLRVDDELGRVIANVVDAETGEVVRSIPPEELVEAAKELKILLGQILDQTI